MNIVKQNKINFSLILIAIFITFSSLTILSLPVLFNYESKLTNIEKNFYENFKIYLKSIGKVSYKPFPKPHLLVEKAHLDFKKKSQSEALIKTENLKIYISLRDIYLRNFKHFTSLEIAKTNFKFNVSNINELRNHLYKNINKPIKISDCKLFIKNKNNEVILISPLNKIVYKINDKNKIKNFNIDGLIYGINFKSEWKRNYDNPTESIHNINLFNPNIKIKNIFKNQHNEGFAINSLIEFLKDKIEYNFRFADNKIKIKSPDNKNLNYNINANINLNPFTFEGHIIIKYKKIEDIIDNFLVNLFIYDKDILGNLDGKFKIKLNEINNKFISDGELDLKVEENKINVSSVKLNLDKIGHISSKTSFNENDGDVIFSSENQLNIKNHIEFAKIFQVGSSKVKTINKIFFDLEKNIGSNEFTISNVRINNPNNTKNSDKQFFIKNIQNLRANFRNYLD
ncbi:hypothetical protein N9U51_01045 [Candidatus Pelagibacter sp.]|nr:hypothetical protein [Candidatus Pelagibacter sp.]